MLGHDLGAAVRAGHAQILESLQRVALTLPIADRVLDEIEGTRLAKVREREDTSEHRLQTMTGPFFGQQVHLQESFVGPALDIDQVRNRQRGSDSGEILAFASWLLDLLIH